MYKCEIVVSFDDRRLQEDEPDIDPQRGLSSKVRTLKALWTSVARRVPDAEGWWEWGWEWVWGCGELLTMPSLSVLIPWSRIFSRALSSAPETSPLGGPSRRSRSKDMLSAAKERLLRADRLLAAIALWGGGGVGASLLALALVRGVMASFGVEGSAVRCCACC